MCRLFLIEKEKKKRFLSPCLNKSCFTLWYLGWHLSLQIKSFVASVIRRRKQNNNLNQYLFSGKLSIHAFFNIQIKMYMEKIYICSLFFWIMIYFSQINQMKSECPSLTTRRPRWQGRLCPPHSSSSRVTAKRPPPLSHHTGEQLLHQAHWLNIDYCLLSSFSA